MSITFNGFNVGDIIRWDGTQDAMEWEWEILSIDAQGYAGVKCLKCPPNKLHVGVLSEGSLKIGRPFFIRKSDNKKSIMQTVSSMGKSVLDADTQTLIKAGFMYDNLELTASGGAALSAIAFVANKAALVAAAQAKLDEETNKNK